MFSKDQAIGIMDEWGANGTPFLFIVDFDGNKNLLYPLNEIPDSIAYSIKGNASRNANTEDTPFRFEYSPVPFEVYQKSFDLVLAELNYGNTYLLNLTFPTKLSTDLNLRTIYTRSNAPYKLLVENSFVVFSPECFIKIEDNIISSFPMKGTIRDNIPEAEKTILEDAKEKAEHATIVDLIRNDLSMVAENVHVAKYRYIDRVSTIKGDLLQVSSKIQGELNPGYQTKLGTILFTLLPAGSISGAPKKKTLEIIETAEIVNRGFFTGIFGVFDGKNLDSGVMIRFIEKENDQLIFKSGGGITAQSDVHAEYSELINKVYVPFV